MKTCYIVAAGDMNIDLPKIDKDDYIIAADAGYLHLQKAGVEPDLIIGDFDSMQEISAKNVEKFPVMKDDTDTMLAIKAGLKKEYKFFKIYGGLGGKRFDHSIANIQSLMYLSAHDANGILIGDNETITIITDGEISFSNEKKGNISVFSIGGKSKGVNIKGLLYELQDAEIDSSFPIGVSNKFKGEASTISVANGSLLIICS